MSRVLIVFSGGMDSATLLGQALHEGHQIDLVHFQYGSKHNQYERIAVNRVMQHYKLGEIKVLWLNNIANELQSNLLQAGGEIPEGHYQAESMRQTVVPGRNLIFTSIAAAIAQSQGIDEVWLGIHSGDHAIYPDCRPEFFEAARAAVLAASEGKVRLVAPFLGLDKAGILEIGYKVGVPYQFTRTCYKDQVASCGVCGSCQERLIAFAEIGKVDPIGYVTRELLPKEGDLTLTDVITGKEVPGGELLRTAFPDLVLADDPREPDSPDVVLTTFLDNPKPAPDLGADGLMNGAMRPEEPPHIPDVGEALQADPELVTGPKGKRRRR